MNIRNIPEKQNEQPPFGPPDGPAGENTPFFAVTAEETFWHSKKGKIWVSFYVLFIVIALEIGVFIYAIGVAKLTPSPEPKADSVEILPTATQTPVAVDLNKYTIIILNGSGIAGTAANAKKILEEEALTVQSIGNASGSARQETSIQAMQNVPEELIAIIRDTLEKQYVLDDEIRRSDSAGADITIIIGTQKASDNLR